MFACPSTVAHLAELTLRTKLSPQYAIPDDKILDELDDADGDNDVRLRLSVQRVAFSQSLSLCYQVRLHGLADQLDARTPSHQFLAHIESGRQHAYGYTKAFVKPNCNLNRLYKTNKKIPPASSVQAGLLTAAPSNCSLTGLSCAPSLSAFDACPPSTASLHTAHDTLPPDYSTSSLPHPTSHSLTPLHSSSVFSASHSPSSLCRVHSSIDKAHGYLSGSQTQRIFDIQQDHEEEEKTGSKLDARGAQPAHPPSPQSSSQQLVPLGSSSKPSQLFPALIKASPSPSSSSLSARASTSLIPPSFHRVAVPSDDAEQVSSISADGVQYKPKFYSAAPSNTCFISTFGYAPRHAAQALEGKIDDTGPYSYSQSYELMCNPAQHKSAHSVTYHKPRMECKPVKCSVDDGVSAAFRRSYLAGLTRGKKDDSDTTTLKIRKQTSELDSALQGSSSFVSSTPRINMPLSPATAPGVAARDIGPGSYFLSSSHPSSLSASHCCVPLYGPMGGLDLPERIIDHAASNNSSTPGPGSYIVHSKQHVQNTRINTGEKRTLHFGNTHYQDLILSQERGQIPSFRPTLTLPASFPSSISSSISSSSIQGLGTSSFGFTPRFACDDKKNHGQEINEMMSRIERGAIDNNVMELTETQSGIKKKQLIYESELSKKPKKRPELTVSIPDTPVSPVVSPSSPVSSALPVEREPQPPSNHASGKHRVHQQIINAHPKAQYYLRKEKKHKQQERELKTMNKHMELCQQQFEARRNHILHSDLMLSRRLMLRQLNSKWLILIKAASRLHYVYNILVQKRIVRLLMAKKEAAALVIQRRWRHYLERQLQKRIAHSYGVLRKNFKVLFFRRRINKRVRGRRKLRLFFTDLYKHFQNELIIPTASDTYDAPGTMTFGQYRSLAHKKRGIGSVVSIIRHYKMQVIRLQQAIRRYLAARNAQIATISKLWDRVYAHQHTLYAQCSKRLRSNDASLFAELGRAQHAYLTQAEHSADEKSLNQQLEEIINERKPIINMIGLMSVDKRESELPLLVDLKRSPSLLPDDSLARADPPSSTASSSTQAATHNATILHDLANMQFPLITSFEKKFSEDEKYAFIRSDLHTRRQQWLLAKQQHEVDQAAYIEEQIRGMAGAKRLLKNQVLLTHMAAAAEYQLFHPLPKFNALLKNSEMISLINRSIVERHKQHRAQRALKKAQQLS